MGNGPSRREATRERVKNFDGVPFGQFVLSRGIEFGVSKLIHAELRGKLGSDASRAHERSEDLLTSAMFGRLRYLRPEIGLFPIIAAARQVEISDSHLSVKRRRDWISLDQVCSYDVEFWPRLGGRAEPDILVRLNCANGVVLHTIIIEVKLWSPKSGPKGGEDADVEVDDESEPVTLHERDQLAKYWHCLQKMRGEAMASIIYLTSHATPPETELRESLLHCSNMRLGWLSWSEVWRVLKGIPGESCGPVVEDLLRLLEHKGLSHFRGFASDLVPQIAPDWQIWPRRSWFTLAKQLPNVPNRFYNSTG